MERAGLIYGLQRQVKFELIPNIYEGKKVAQRSASYIADFVYQEKESNGESHIVVEDAKGVRTDVYKLKKKLMRWVHGIEIQEV
jgi:hypothetical protein